MQAHSPGKQKRREKREKREKKFEELGLEFGTTNKAREGEKLEVEEEERETVNLKLLSRSKVVVTSNPGCLLQIQAGLRKAGATDVEAMHIADFLDRAAR